MVGMPIRRRCHICGAKEGLVRCVACDKLTCQLHIVGGKCHDCVARETIHVPASAGSMTLQGKPKAKAAQPERLTTRVKFGGDPQTILADLYLLLGGRPGSRRSTTLMGSLHLDQRTQELMFDRQVARRVNAATFYRLRAPGLGEIETRPYMNSKTRRVAHDMAVRMVDLVSRSVGGGGVQILGGASTLGEIELDEDITCPICGAWREVCQCRHKPHGRIRAEDYFKTMMMNRLRQRQIGLRMEPKDKNQELRARIPRWLETLSRIPDGIQSSADAG